MKRFVIDFILLTVLAVFCMVLIFSMTFAQNKELVLSGNEETAVLGELYPGKSVRKEYNITLAGRVTFSLAVSGEGALADYINARVEFDNDLGYDGKLSELFGKTLARAAENAITVRTTFELAVGAESDLQNADLSLTLTFSQS